jgi:hypothetical protein
LAQGRTIYIDADANGLNDGTSWADAYTYLQDALADANSAAKPVEIRVAEGIYTPDSNSADPNGTGDRTATFQLINSVTIQGGYAGFGQPDPNARNIDLYETILSGDLDGNDIDVNDPAFLLWEPTRAENSYHVVTGTGMDTTALLDGFVIIGGNANGPRQNDQDDGGGMYNDSGNPTIRNCTLSRNSAKRIGGGMFNRYGNPTVLNCTVSWNSGFTGGGMFNAYSSPALTNCTFSGNSASYGGGGGMFNYWGSSPMLTNCTFSRNWTSDDGGGMSNSRDSNPTLVNCTFNGNSAEYYGSSGMYNSDSYPTLTNCILWGDTSGEIYTEGPGVSPVITYSNVQGGWPGEGNIDADPCFADAPNGDYNLLPTSPCIDAGDPNYVPEPNETDLDGKPRILDGNNDGIAVVDMGAYEYRPLIPAEVDLDPDTLNLASKGKWIAAFLWLPEGYDVADIDPNSVLLEHEIEPERFWVYEEEQIAIAKFNRSEVQGILNIGQSEVTITGQLTDGTKFEGADVIRVINKGGRNSPK